jgi:hypothetical protein
MLLSSIVCLPQADEYLAIVAASQPRHLDLSGPLFDVAVRGAAKRYDQSTHDDVLGHGFATMSGLVDDFDLHRPCATILLVALERNVRQDSLGQFG